MSREVIRRVVQTAARLPVDIATVDDEDDLYLVGLTSHASVSLMLALEDAFDLELPDEMLTRDVFRSVSSMNAAISTLRGGAFT